MSAKSVEALPRAPISWWLLLVATPGLIALAWLLVTNIGYYSAPLIQQALREEHPLLRSSGRVGLVLGITGTMMMGLNLLYLVRRRAVTWRWAGSLRAWMNFHITTGLLAGGLILMHSCLAWRSAPGTVAAVSMTIVIITGIMGRYIYGRVPRSLEGRELRIEEIRENLDYMRRQLERLGVHLPGLARVRPLDDDESRTGKRRRLGVLRLILLGDPDARRRLNEARKQLKSETIPPEVYNEANKLIGRMFREMTWLERYNGLRSLMASWRFLHLWLAIVLFCSASSHILLALVYGDLWIFR
ncbi:MAG: hypothetical protein AB7K09_01685 [Planctomycetota bacterium]